MKKATFVILTYNQERFVAEAVEAAFAQTYSPLRIVISDDCSTDGTFDVIKRLTEGYRGPHEVVLNRNERNLGIREHVNKVLYDMEMDDYIILAAGDDVSDARRTEVYVDFFERFPEVMSVSCASLQCDAELNPLKRSGKIRPGTYSILTLGDYCRYNDFTMLSGDSRALRREVIEAFPKLRYPDAEDIYLFVRSIMLGSCCYIRQPLVKRRHWGGNVSHREAERLCAPPETRREDREDMPPLERQMLADIDHAARHGILSEAEKAAMLKKVESLRTMLLKSMEQYRNSYAPGR